MSEFKACKLCGSDPLPATRDKTKIGCGAGAGACPLTELPEQPEFTLDQWEKLMAKTYSPFQSMQNLYDSGDY